MATSIHCFDLFCVRVSGQEFVMLAVNRGTSDVDTGSWDVDEWSDKLNLSTAQQLNRTNMHTFLL